MEINVLKILCRNIYIKNTLKEHNEFVVDSLYFVSEVLLILLRMHELILKNAHHAFASL
mgnify:CR=1 FL=1